MKEEVTRFSVSCRQAPSFRLKQETQLAPTHGLPNSTLPHPGTCKSICLGGASGLAWLMRSCSLAFRSGYLLAAIVGSLTVVALGEGLWMVIWLVLYARRRWERLTPGQGW